MNTSVATKYSKEPHLSPKPHLLVLVGSNPHELSFRKDVCAEGAATSLLEVDGLVGLVISGFHHVYPWLVLVH